MYLVGNNFNPLAFIDKQIHEIKKVLGEEKALIACSGGVDSTTCAVLTRKAIGKNLICVFIDTNFMRLNEPETVINILSQAPLELPIKIIRAQEEFMEALQGLEDAEEKRKAFRNTFYSVLSRVAEKEKCQFLVQGTILPDILETIKGIKTQHNVLEQMKIDTGEIYGFKVIEPLVSLYKPQVRKVARYLGLSFETSERQPFPGPGLSVRVIGKITSAKLDVEKKATEIIEEKLKELRPKQYFPATIDSQKTSYYDVKGMKNMILSLLKEREIDVMVQTLRARATGIKDDARLYGKILTVNVRDEMGKCVELPMSTLDSIQRRVTEIDDGVSRVLYRVTDKEQGGKLIVAIRAVDTYDFVTASIFNIPWDTLKEIGELMLNTCIDVSTVYYDITPKPPASIEFE